MSSAEKSVGTSLRSVINAVTKEKLAWLEKQRETLKTHFASVLEKYGKPENKSSLNFLKEIHAALLSAHGDNPIPTLTKELSVFLNWIEAEDENGAIYFGSSRLVESWIETLVRHIKLRIEKCEYSCLYANVMSQYMESNSEEESDLDKEELGAGDTGSSEPTTKEETIQEFSRLVFSDTPNFSKEKFEDFVKTQLFNEKDPVQKEILNNAREKVQEFCKSFDSDYDGYSSNMNTSTLKLSIQGLLRENLLSEDKTKTLKELLENSAALEEVCTLVDKRIKNYKQWTWPEPIHVDFRRNIAGRYRAYMEEDVITAIILHYLGAKWSITLKSVFKTIYASSMWKRENDAMGQPCKSASIEGYRREFHGGSFLSILPDELEDLASEGAGYDDDVDDRKTVKEFSPMEIKKKVLHLISNEIHLNNVLRPKTPLTVVQTDVEWFGPSIVHETILSVMKFFGVTDHWLAFFRKFLETPLRVGSAKAPVQVRKRGSPISHTFTALFGETILFIMDLYVNQVSGLNVYRIHDDFWLWSHDQKAVEKAWTSMQTFVKLADLKLNEEKSASVVCSSDATPDMIASAAKPLPQGQVKWGFVVLHSDGVYRISKSLLEAHVKEMRECLVQAQTLMSWVHCHNKYIRFFIRNFVEPAKTLQKQHLVQILESLRAILIKVHEETKGDAVAALKLKFSDILGDKEIIDSWVYWPVQKGGLNLYNPFLDLIPLHEAYRKSEENSIKFGDGLGRFQRAVNSDEREWKKYLEQSKIRRKKRQNYDSSVPLEDETITDHELFRDENNGGNMNMFDDDDLLSREEKKRKRIAKRVNYTTWCERNREFRSSRWRGHYVELLNPIRAPRCQSGNWRQWLYEDLLEANLGNNEDEFVDTNLVPLSLISSMQGDRVHKN